MFSFGLLSVVHYGLALYTGKSGFFTNTTELVDLLYIIAGNFVGCWLVSLIFDYASPQYVENAQKIVDVIAGKSLLAVFLLAIPCGFIMSTAVKFAREGRFLSSSCAASGTASRTSSTIARRWTSCSFPG